MQHNDLRKGTKVLLTGGRMGTIMDNRKGIRRMVKIEERDGWYGDMGDVYIDEITHILHPADTHPSCPDPECTEPVELSKAHAKQMGKIRQSLNQVF